MNASGLDEHLELVEEPIHEITSCDKPEDLVNASSAVGSCSKGFLLSNTNPNPAPIPIIVSSLFEQRRRINSTLVDGPLFPTQPGCSPDQGQFGFTKLSTPAIGKSQLVVKYIFDPRENALSPLSVEPVPLATKPTPGNSNSDSDSCEEGWYAYLKGKKQSLPLDYQDPWYASFVSP
ncbi:hypothetical protein NE237_023734 [Protea cynaroides]|uniref:Uncharacterized protein n=1 Tax=Protea cynaroides TaxID=273540 RepID=A0A9Q0HDG1_9MAGN|nr:hypothetical protein NE237_023734 [Protea cynaroides]